MNKMNQAIMKKRKLYFQNKSYIFKKNFRRNNVITRKTPFK